MEKIVEIDAYAFFALLTGSTHKMVMRETTSDRNGTWGFKYGLKDGVRTWGDEGDSDLLTRFTYMCYFFRYFGRIYIDKGYLVLEITKGDDFGNEFPPRIEDHVLQIEKELGDRDFCGLADKKEMKLDYSIFHGLLGFVEDNGGEIDVKGMRYWITKYLELKGV